MFQFKINGERLKKLMNDNNIKAYKLSKELEKMGYSISTNTITNYMNEKTPPKNLEYVKAIADYFNVSTDFLLGIAPTPTNNINIKDFCNKYSINEKALSALEFLKEKPADFNPNIINTINYLLEDILINNHNSILNVITDYIFFTNIGNSINVPFNINSKTGVTEILTVKSDTAVKSILINEIEEELNLLKDKIIKEGEKSEYKRKSKK